MDRTVVLCLLILAIIIGSVFFVRNEDKKNENYTPNMVRENLPTSEEVEFIQGEPDFHMVDPVDDTEIIREGDIALDPGFGMGEGTVGFGRYGSSFII